MQDLEKEIIDALGLKNVIELDLHFKVDRPITMDVLAYPDRDKIGLLAPIFKKYELQVKEDQ